MLSPEESSRLRAVVFDLDDTLCAYWDAAKLGLARAFDAHPVRPREEMHAAWVAAFQEYCPKLKHLPEYATYLRTGEPTRTEAMRRMLVRLGVEDPALARQIGDTYAAERLGALALFADAREVLGAVRPRRLGLLTNGPADVQRDEVRVLGLEGVFDAVVIEGEFGRGKPEVEVFRHIEGLLEAEPAEILMVGNSYHHDIVGAIEAGWRTAWVRRASDVPPASRSGKPEERPGHLPAPDMEISELCELLPLLRG